MGCGPIRAGPIGPDFIRDTNFTARPSKISGQFGPVHRARPIFPALVPITVVKIEMTNFIKKLVGTGSSTSSSRIDEQLRQIQENTLKYENKLSVSIEDWEQYIKNWEMPKQNIKELYKVGSFEFKRDYRIILIQ